MSLTVPSWNIKPTSKQKLEILMPEEYYTVRQLDEVHFQILVDRLVCATVTLENDRFKFSFAEDEYSGFWGGRLREGILDKHPEFDPERLLWIVVMRWHGHWSYYNRAQPTREDALNYVSHGTFESPGAMLVGFKASEWSPVSLKVEQSYALSSHDEHVFQVSDTDEGEKTFSFTDLENATK